MNRFAFALLASVAFGAPAMAQTQGHATTDFSETDGLRIWDYNPQRRYRIINTIGRATVLTFSPEETIIRVTYGKEDIWEGPPAEEVREIKLRNVISLSPVAKGFISIQITTRRPILGDRVYQFAALARDLPPECDRPGVEVCEDPESVFGVTFRYPLDEAEAQAAEAKAQAAEAKAEADRKRAAWEAQAPLRAMQVMQVQQARANGRLRTEPFGGGECRNWAYDAQANSLGRDLLVPNGVSDNGIETQIEYRGERPTPAYYVVSRDAAGKIIETPIQPRGAGIAGVSVLPIVAKEIRVRSGDAVVALFNKNENYRPEGCSAGTGTVSPGVARVLRHAAASPRRAAAP